MQLNFLGLIVLAIGIILLGLGITGNYKTFGPSIVSSFKAGRITPSAGSERAPGVSEPGGPSVTKFNPPTNTHTLQS